MQEQKAQKTPWARSTIIVFVVIAAAVAAAIVYLFSGFYNIAATEPHWSATVWLIGQVRDRSVKFHSRGINPRDLPSDLKDPKLLKPGTEHYHEMCRLCHGAPGYEKEELAKGLYPKPPNLASRKIQGMSDAEMFWVLKNGIKMTGMPAFGPSHDEDELWAIVAFIRHLPKLRRGEYEALAKAPGGHEEEEHHHGSKSR